MPRAEEIFPFIYALPLGYVNAFLIAEEDGLTLVDSGLNSSEKKIRGALAEIQRPVTDLRNILITHHHADHVGSLASLKAESGARAYVHPLDAPIVAGEKPRPPANRASVMGRVLGPLIMRMRANNPAPATADSAVNDGDEVPVAGGVKVVHTPGHTAGHVSYLVPGHGGILFAGDAAGHMFGRLGKPIGMFTEDWDAAKASIRKLAELEFDTACFGHGGVLKGKANAAFRRYVEKMGK
jgi:glyoxylase-like metal-dependent hydrolase (beta-lactamase superfamily II)